MSRKTICPTYIANTKASIWDLERLCFKFFASRNPFPTWGSHCLQKRPVQLFTIFHLRRSLAWLMLVYSINLFRYKREPICQFFNLKQYFKFTDVVVTDPTTMFTHLKLKERENSNLEMNRNFRNSSADSSKRLTMTRLNGDEFIIFVWNPDIGFPTVLQGPTRTATAGTDPQPNCGYYYLPNSLKPKQWKGIKWEWSF